MPVIELEPDRGTPEYQPPGNNAPAVTGTRPIVAQEPKSAPQPEKSDYRQEATLPAPAVPEPHQWPERIAATGGPTPAEPVITAAPRDPSIRSAEDAGSRIAGGLVSSLLRGITDTLADFFEGLFAERPPPPTEQEIRQAEIVAEQREHTAEDTAHRVKAEEDLRLRLEQQIKDDLARQQRERDDEHYRGRQRER